MSQNEDLTTGTATDQFSIADHYNKAMSELDKDVHDDHALSEAEVALTLRLLGFVPRRLFLPCGGTGRHIRYFLAAGVEEIVLVDLSGTCVATAQSEHGSDPRVTLIVGDLTDPDIIAQVGEVDATVVLGNSFADAIDHDVLAAVTAGMVTPLRPGGVFLMDYVSDNYLLLCAAGHVSTWDADFYGRPVKDARTPTYDPSTGVMTINVVATAVDGGEVLWEGYYQKAILDDAAVMAHLEAGGLTTVVVHGQATELIPNYYGDDSGERGMIALSHWYTAVKV